MSNASDNQANGGAGPPVIPARPVVAAKAAGVGLEAIEAMAPLLALPRWCGWGWRFQPGRTAVKEGYWRKMPLIPGPEPEGQEDAKALRTNHPEEAGTYAAAKAMVLRGAADGVGWLVTGEREWGWLDLDHCNDETGQPSPWAQMLVARAEIMGAYVERTPSGEGMRIFGRVNLNDEGLQTALFMQRFLAGLNEQELAAWGGSRACHPKAAIEVFFACTRYVTLTGWDAAGGGGGDITGLMLEVFEAAEKQLGAARRGRAPKGKGGTGGGWWAPIEDVISALAGIPNDHVSWDYWNTVCMAVWNATGQSEEGLLAFCGWSAKCEFKHVEAHCADNWERLWRSPPNNIGFGWLAKEAKKANKDWRRPSRSPGAEFERENDPGDARPGREVAQGTIDAFVQGVAFIVDVDRWFNTNARRTMKFEGLQHLAGRMNVKGHSNTGAKSIAARLRSDPRLKELVGLGCFPGQGAIVEGVNEQGERGLVGNFWKRGGVQPSNADAGVFLEFAEAVIEDAADRERVFNRLAWMLQNPGKKVNGALVLVGPQGAGKDTFLVPFWAAVGEHNVSIVQGNVIGGEFTEYLKRQYVFITEMPPAHKRDRYEEIKSWLATPPDRLVINEKMQPRYSIPNIVNVVITTNHISAVALADDDRRFDIIQTRHAIDGGDDRRDEHAAYFDRVYAWFKAGGCEAVAGWLLRRDVSAFNPAAAPPHTRAKAQMTREGAHPATGWVMDVLAPRGPFGQRNLATIIEIMDLAKHGGWGAGAAVANWITADHVSRGLSLSGWRHVTRTEIEGSRQQVWARRNCPLELLKQLPGRPWATLLEEDRKKSAAIEF